MHGMTKTFFHVVEDQGEKYVVKRDELQKNHGAFDREAFSGFMPENKDWDMCPVRSFELYLAKLHPDSDKLWQRPSNDLPADPDAPWYVKLYL